MLVTVNGVFLGNAATPIIFTTEENALLYFSVMPLKPEQKPFAFSLRVNREMSLPQEYGHIVFLPANRYELRLNAPKYKETFEPPIKKVLQKIKVSVNSSQANFKIIDQNNLDYSKISQKIGKGLITLDAVEKSQNTDSVINQPETTQSGKTGSKSNKPVANKTYIVSLINDGADRICVECGKDAFYYTLPQNLKNLTLKAEILNNNLVAAVMGEKQDDVFKEKYLLVIKGKPNNYEVKIEGFFDLVHQEGKKISALTLNRDIALRGKVSVFDGQSLEKIEEYYVYVNKEPNRTDDIRLMPIAVFEAVKCKDFAEAKYYLTESLNAILTEEKLEEFFADYVDIIPNNYYSQYPHSFLLIDKNNKASLFKAVYRNNKIDNFFEVEFK
ncbi:MAG TPA: hypothetical protein VIL03_05010 [Clostridia bacterium]|jgi:hypothetical protein